MSKTNLSLPVYDAMVVILLTVPPPAVLGGTVIFVKTSIHDLVGIE